MVESAKKPEKDDLEEIIEDVEQEEEERLAESFSDFSGDRIIEIVPAFKDRRENVLIEPLEEMEEVKRAKVKKEDEGNFDYSQPKKDEEDEDKYADMKKQEQFYHRARAIENPLTKSDFDDGATRIRDEYETEGEDSVRYRSASEIAEEGKDILGEQAKKYDVKELGKNHTF